MTDIERREPVLTGEITPPTTELISIITVVNDRACPDCDHPASRHRDTPPGSDELLQRLGRETGPNCAQCACRLSRLEAAGWTGPDERSGHR